MTVDVPLVGAYMVLTACAVLEINRYRRKRKDMSEGLFRWAYNMGIIAGYVVTDDCCNRCITAVQWKGRRPYVLGCERDRAGY